MDEAQQNMDEAQQNMDEAQQITDEAQQITDEAQQIMDEAQQIMDEAQQIMDEACSVIWGAQGSSSSCLSLDTFVLPRGAIYEEPSQTGFARQLPLYNFVDKGSDAYQTLYCDIDERFV